MTHTSDSGGDRLPGGDDNCGIRGGSTSFLAMSEGVVAEAVAAIATVAPAATAAAAAAVTINAATSFLAMTRCRISFELLALRWCCCRKDYSSHLRRLSACSNSAGDNRLQLALQADSKAVAPG